jgi:hypothetical protein
MPRQQEPKRADGSPVPTCMCPRPCLSTGQEAEEWLGMRVHACMRGGLACMHA